MNIPLSKLLRKMEEEIKKAQSATSEASIRERVRAIKTLCELVLDETESVSHAKPAPTSSGEVSSSIPAQRQLMIPSQDRKLIDDDDANGDSLFDF